MYRHVQTWYRNIWIMKNPDQSCWPRHLIRNFMELWPANMEVYPTKHGAKKVKQQRSRWNQPTNQKKNVLWNGNVLEYASNMEIWPVVQHGNVIHKNPWGSGAPFMNRSPLDQGFGCAKSRMGGRTYDKLMWFLFAKPKKNSCYPSSNCLSPLDDLAWYLRPFTPELQQGITRLMLMVMF